MPSYNIVRTRSDIGNFHVGKPTPYVPPPFINTNSMRVSTTSGTQTNYPLQFGRPFRYGEIRRFPEVLLEGVAIPTQADIKNRWPDGSVKFAVISIVLPTVTTSAQTITFRNRASQNSTPVTIASMLADFDFDCAINVQKNGSPIDANVPVSARAWLQSLTDSDLASGSVNSRYWTSGPVCTSVILADHTSKSKDLGSTADRVIRPMFHIQFWPGINTYRVRPVLEIADWTKVMDEMGIEVTISTGQSSPAIRYAQSGIDFYAYTWLSREYWKGGEDRPTLDVDFNIAYLSETKVVPNFKPGLSIVPATITSFANDWATKTKNFGDGGYWAKTMALVGGRMDLGLMPKWDCVAAVSGRAPMQDISIQSAELSGSWAMFFREGDASRNIIAGVSGIGRVPSKLSRSLVYTGADNLYIDSGNDRPTVVGPYDRTSRGGWSHDEAHTPGLYWWPYLSTGGSFWQEKLLQLAGWALFFVNPGVGYNSVANGRAVTDMVINGAQPRGWGWQMRNRARAWWAALDNSPEKELYRKALEDACAMHAGLKDVPGMMEDNPIRQAWNSNFNTWYGGAPANPRPNNFGYWAQKGAYTEGQLTSATGSPPPSDWGGGAQALWMQSYIVMSLWHCYELGYTECRPLAEWATRLSIDIVNSSEPRHIGDYVIPDAKNDDGFYQSAESLWSTWDHNADGSYPTYMPASNANGFPGAGPINNYVVTVEGYATLATVGIAMAADAGMSSAIQAWNVVQPWQNNTIYYNHDPRYSIFPRGY